MRLDFHNQFASPSSVVATRLIIYDNLGNPIALFMDSSDKIIICSTAGDGDFSEELRKFGIAPPIVKTISATG